MASASDLASLKERLHELQSEQAASAVEGVHYQKFDVMATQEKRAAAMTERRCKAIAPMTPSKPPSAAPPVNRPRTNAEIIDAADAAARRESHLPVDISADTSRSIHAVQQEALNAETRAACEGAIDSWKSRADALKDAVFATAHETIAASSSAAATLKRYEDLYQCVHPLDDAGVMAGIEMALRLQVSQPEMNRFIDEIPPVDREACLSAFAELGSAFKGPGCGMPRARRELRLQTLSTIDEPADATVGAAAVRLYEDLYLNVLGPLRETLDHGDAQVAALRLQAQHAASRKEKARAAAGKQVEVQEVPQSSTAGELLKEAESHQATECETRMEAVHEHASRVELVLDAYSIVEAHRQQCTTDLELCAEISSRFLKAMSDAKRRVAVDTEALRNRHDVIAKKMLEDHKRYLADQSQAHGMLSDMQVREQALWAEITAKATEAAALADARRRLVLERMSKREEEAIRQRISAQEMGLVRRRQYRTESAGRVFDVLAEVANSLTAYTDNMSNLIRLRDVDTEHRTILKTECSAGCAEFARTATVVHDLTARCKARAAVVDRAVKQAKLHAALAAETLDPEARSYSSRAEIGERDASELRDHAAKLASRFSEVAEAATPMLDHSIGNGWIPEDVDDTSADSESDPAFSAQTKALAIEMQVQSRTRCLVDEEQTFAEQQLTDIRHAHADAAQATKQHETRRAASASRPRIDAVDEVPAAADS